MSLGELADLATFGCAVAKSGAYPNWLSLVELGQPSVPTLPLCPSDGHRTRTCQQATLASLPQTRPARANTRQLKPSDPAPLSSAKYLHTGKTPLWIILLLVPRLRPGNETLSYS